MSQLVRLSGDGFKLAPLNARTVANDWVVVYVYDVMLVVSDRLDRGAVPDNILVLLHDKLIWVWSGYLADA